MLEGIVPMIAVMQVMEMLRQAFGADLKREETGTARHEAEGHVGAQQQEQEHCCAHQSSLALHPVYLHDGEDLARARLIPPVGEIPLGVMTGAGPCLAPRRDPYTITETVLRGLKRRSAAMARQTNSTNSTPWAAANAGSLPVGAN